MCSLAYIKITKCFVEFEIFLRKYFKGNKAKNGPLICELKLSGKAEINYFTFLIG